MTNNNPQARLWRRMNLLSGRQKLVTAGVIIAAVLLLVPLITYAQLARDISDPERLMNRNKTGIVLMDKHGEVFYNYGKLNHQTDLKLDKISDHMERAVVASEDKEFYNHTGWSLRGTLIALYANVLNKDLKRYGGSTITQQLVKNNLLSNEKSYLRKYQEVAVAIAVERNYSKDDILAMYLNSVYFGEGAFGISQAAHVYFGKQPQDLSLAESSMLVGLLPAPSTYSPVSGDKAKAKEQQDRVLDHMIEAGYISKEEKERTSKQQIALKTGQEGNVQLHAQHFAMMVLEELKQRYGEERIIRSGFQVTTTLDLNWQKHAEGVVRERVAQLQAQGGNNASLVAIDPKSGQLRALVGSANWDNPDFGKVNMALAARQPGSSFKPIYYAEAFDKKLITPATIMKDEPKVYGDGYRPENYDFKYRGDITVRRSLALSLNIPSVAIMEKLGPEEAAQAAQRMGVSTITEPQKYGLTLGVGTAEAKLLEMTNAYAALANHGQQFETASILSIKDKYDKKVFNAKKAKGKTVVSPEAAFLTSSILSDKEAGAATFGQSLVVPGRPTATKTGTTDDNRDAWTIGYTPSVSVGVWLGNNANEPMSGVAGASGAAPIWRQGIQGFVGDSPAEQFQQPEDVSKLRVCSSNGLRAGHNGPGTYEEYFIKGTEPTGTCQAPVKPKIEKKPEKKEEQKKEEEDKKKEEEEERLEAEPGGGRGGGEPQEPTEPEPQEPTEPEPEEPPQPEPEQPPSRNRLQ
jgi:penicillin-binding protein 1C